MATYNVYEFRNETLKESCVLKSQLSLEELRWQFQAGKEPRVAHWDWSAHAIRALDVELALQDSAADEFLHEYAKTMTPLAGWRAV